MIRPDYEDEPNESLPSFKFIRQKTFSTLYEFDHRDKSPKGSVDAPIQGLVDLINSHPSFATLSSCSGRIAMFDPAGAPSIDEASLDDEIEVTGEPSGKGKGRWLLAAHENVSLEHVLAQLENIKDQSAATSSQHSVTSFRFEPMLLHVAACNLNRGKQLLQIALQRGFRESGLVVTASRVTVAIRSYSLALTVPLMRSGPWQVSADYLSALVHDCNERLQANWKRLCDLQETIRKTLFRMENLPTLSASGFHVLPELNLWGHTCVAIESSNGRDTSTDILAFGGYGTGPHMSSMTEAPTGASRSNRVYRLRQSNDGFWDESWTAINVVKKETSHGKIRGMLAEAIDWTSRERSAACFFPQIDGSNSKRDLVLLFGGRKSPGVPMADLILFEYASTSSSSFYELKGIAGTAPSARWGHTLTTISGGFAFLTGGRNANSVVEDSFFILSVQSDDSKNLFLQWENVDRIGDIFCRFDHASCCTSDHFFVFGGLNDTSELLAPFSKKEMGCNIFDVKLWRTSSTMSINCLDDTSCGIGFEACVLQESTDAECRKVQILLSGGILPNTDADNSKQPISAIELTNEDEKWTVTNRSTIELPEFTDMGPLVSHSQVLLSSATNHDTIRVVCVGGGTAGFSFRPCFAKSFCLELKTSQKNQPSTDNHEKDASVDPRQVTKNSYPSAIDNLATNAKVCVAFVKKQNAKEAKNLLENLGYLSETHRMGPAEKADSLHGDHLQYVALPIKAQAMSLLEEENDSESLWTRLVEGTGRQCLPFRTAMFARKK